MKNVVLLLIALFTIQFASAQLYAENNAFIFSKGSNVFVKKKVRLRNGTAFYLRGEAQLTQKDDVDNEGSGILSVYQEGTTNEYTYNYWSSPVSNEATGIDGNVGFSRTMIKYPLTDGAIEDFATDAGDPIFLNAPNYNGRSDNGRTTAPLQIAGYWLWNFDSSGNETAGYAGWIPFQDDTTVLEPGYGFTMKGVRQRTGNNPNFRSYNGINGQRYDLRGRANNGTITMGVGNDNGTLIGNPYPSAVDLKRFLEVNAENVSGNDVKINPEIRYWVSVDETSHYLVDYLGGYGVYVPMGFEAGSNDGYDNSGEYIAPVFRRTDNDGNIITDGSFTQGSNVTGGRRYAAIGQGFFVCRTNTAVAEGPNSFAATPPPNISPGVQIGTDNGNPVIGENVIFNNSMRKWVKENGNSSIFRRGDVVTDTENSLSSMTLNVVHRGEYARPLKMVFHDNTTMDYDHAWEGPLNNRLGNDAYIKVEDGEYGLATQPFDINMRIPIGVEVRHDNNRSRLVEFEIAQFVNFTPSEVYLYDNFSGVYHDIKSNNQFLLLQPGHYSDRFEITFTNTTLSNPDVDLSNLEIYQNNKLKQLSVLNPNLLDVRDITLYDLAGRLVIKIDKQEVQSNYNLSTETFSTGIYIAKVTTNDDQEKTSKVSISN
ncbi:MAG: T9SS type A sorting domain-containing protein [Nonlabens sp.]